MTREDDEVAGHLLRRQALPGGPKAGGCPDDNALGAYLEGRAEPRAREELERHVAGCASCQGVVAETLALRGGAPPASGATEATRRSRRVWVPWAAAALLLIGLVVAGLLINGLTTGRMNYDDDRVLTMATSEARRQSPDLLLGFEPLLRQERTSIPPTRLRGPLAVMRPAETVLETRPECTWSASPGATGYEVILSTETGAVHWRQTVGAVTSAPFAPNAPDLAPGGAYVVRVETRGPLGRSDAVRHFRVASAEQRTGLARVQSLLPGPVLPAHYAIRQGLLLEAERMLLEEDADNALVRETLLYVRRRLGVPEP